MSPKYLNDRYEVKSTRLRSEAARDRSLIAIVRSFGKQGAIYHLLEHVRDQFDDTYTILIDDVEVVTFEVGHGNLSVLPDSVKVWSFDEYRHHIGQGKKRMRLDRAAEAVRSDS